MIPAEVKLIKQGRDQLKVIGLAALPREEALKVVQYIKDNKAELLRTLEAEPVKEFMELARRGVARLHTDGSGGLWWSTAAQDVASVEHVQRLWLQAFEELFQMLYRGELDEVVRLERKYRR